VPSVSCKFEVQRFTRLDHRVPVRDLRHVRKEVELPIDDVAHPFQDVFSLPRSDMHDNEIGRGVRDTIPFDRLRDLDRQSRACLAARHGATHVIGWIEIPDDLGMERLCAHGLRRRGEERLNGGGLQVQGARNLSETAEHDVDEPNHTDQRGVDECKVDRIALLVALVALQRRRPDDARADCAGVADVLELGGEHDGVDEFGAAVDLEQLHRGSDPSEAVYPRRFLSHTSMNILVLAVLTVLAAAAPTTASGVLTPQNFKQTIAQGVWCVACPPSDAS
jgi:hypothetical protein